MAGEGFIHDPSSDINTIRNNLRDGYRVGFPIIKELVQNSDDATGATFLHIGWVPGIPHANHALLRGPALFAVNDGQFASDDADSIRRMGLSNKVGKKSSIGRFGLGLKSVFHLCEAFFYLASADPSTNLPIARRNRIVNPWSGEDKNKRYLHEDWDNFSEQDQLAIQQCLDKVLNRERWFCLWIPLRRDEHCRNWQGKKCKPIFDEFPGNPTSLDNFRQKMFAEDVQIRLASLMPMLRNLKTIQGWLPDKDSGKLHSIFSLEFGKESPERCRYREGLKTGSWALQGSIHLNSIQRLPFGGVEALLDNQEFQNLKASPNWPGFAGINHETGESKHSPDDADPHCAVYFAQNPDAQKDELLHSWAVFLPVGEEPDKENYQILMMLHGYLFVDAGRALIFDLDHQITPGDQFNKEDLIRSEWNYQLIQKGILPLVLPALEQFTRSAKLSQEKVISLTNFLAKSTLFVKHQEIICNQYQWIYRITETDGEWQLIDGANPIYDIPPADFGLLGQVFPILTSLSSNYYVTFHDLPRLSRHTSMEWDAGLLVQLIDCIPVAEVFGNKGYLKYLVTFLKSESVTRVIYNEQVQERLHRMLQAAFTQVKFNDLRSQREYLHELLRFIPAGKRFVFYKESPVWDKVLLELMKFKFTVLIVPAGLDSKNEEEPNQIPVEDSIRLLRFLNILCTQSRNKDNTEEVCVEIVLQVIGGVDGAEREYVLNQCSDLKLFQGQDFSTDGNKGVLFSWVELNQLRNHRSLFANRAGNPETLQKALKKSRIVLITPQAAKVLYGDQQIPQYYPDSCIQTLLAKPTLSEPNNRLDLLSFIQTRVSVQGYKEAVRYLLHGQKEDHGGLLLVSRNTGQHTVWAKIAHQVFPSWHVISENLANKLARDPNWQILGLSEIDAVSLVERIREVGPEQIDCTHFDPMERITLFRGISEADHALIFGLHIHEDIYGEITTINEKTYLDGKYRDCLEENLLKSITVITQYGDPVLAATQKRLFEQLPAKRLLNDPNVAIKIVLEQECPATYWQIIMGILQGPDVIPSLDEGVVEKLKITKWLMTQSGQSISPAQVIYIRGVEGNPEFDRLIPNHAAIVAFSYTLDINIQQHAAFPILVKDIFPSLKQALTKLGEIMAENAQYHLGLIDHGNFDKEALTEFLSAFQKVSSEVMPAYFLIETLAKKVSNDDLLQYLLPHLFCVLSEKRMISLLHFLSERKPDSREQKQRMLKVYNRYLRAAVQMSTFDTDILPHIKLLNKGGGWKAPQELCFAVEGIDDDDLLDERQGKILKGETSKLDELIKSNKLKLQVTTGTSSEAHHRPGNFKDDWETLYKKGVLQLKKYFADWTGIVDQEVIGGFLCLLGSYEEMEKLAQDYLGRTWEVRDVRETLGWMPPISILGIKGLRVAGYGEDIHEVMGFHRYIVEIIEVNATTRTVASLLPEKKFEAKLSQKLKHLFVVGDEDFSYEYDKASDYRVNRLQLRKIPIHPEKADERERLSDLLEKSAKKIIEVFYEPAKVMNFDDAWQRLLHQSDSRTIEVAQERLIEAAFNDLPKYGLRTHDKFKSLLSQYDDAFYKSKELADREKGEAKEALKNLLRNDAVARSTVLQAVRKKIGADFQYQRESILFELFQNADDAVTELAYLYGGDEFLNTANRRIVVFWDQDRVMFMHWGRRINQDYCGSPDRQEPGFADDLRKMLTVQDSDKLADADNRPVTGKFGLGFKSVFLITNQPRVVSGKRGFEIVGGIYPFHLAGSHFDYLREQLEQNSCGSENGTLFELPIDPGLSPHVDVDSLGKKFSDLAPILVVFARQIRSCELHIKDSQTIVSWNAQYLSSKTNRVCFGLLPLVQDAPRMAIALTADQGTLLLLLNNRGFDRFKTEIPTIWVTVPAAGERYNLGFVINGSFDLDVGRAQLARASTKNEELCVSIGNQIGEALIQLFDASQDWMEFCYTLNLKDVPQYHFWETLWQRLGSEFSNSTNHIPRQIFDLLRELLWGTEAEPRGLAKLITERATLPTGLWGDYKVLTQLKRVRYVVNKDIFDENVFSKVSKWPSFSQQNHPKWVEAGTIVSSSIKDIVDNLLPKALNSEVLSLRRLVEWQVDRDYKIDPEVGSQLGQLITPDFMNKLETGGRSQALEYGMLRGQRVDGSIRPLNEWLFLGEDKKYSQAKELLIAIDNIGQEGEQEEQMRARFAPKDKVLSAAYKGDALQFFKSCRQDQPRANIAAMAGWALTANEDQQRQAVLEYLLKGNYRDELAKELRSRKNGTWLAEIDNSSLLKWFDIWKQRDIQLKLHMPSAFTPVSPPIIPIGPVDDRQSVQVTLKTIYDWWRKEKEFRIRKYEESLYLDGQPPVVTPQDIEDVETNVQIRQNWLILFLLGAFHTIGRKKRGQDRGFLEFCRRQGYLQVFANENIDPQNWIDVLKNYLDKEDDHFDYYHWMRQFVSVFHFANWLPAYVESFLSLNDNKPFTPDQILRPRTNPRFQFGAGVDAPPLSSALRIGAHFIIRELTRFEVVRNNYAYRYCYVPTEDVRNLFEALGCEEFTDYSAVESSQIIHNFLNKHMGELSAPYEATFLKCFDLPFLLIARDEKLQHKLLNGKIDYDEYGQVRIFPNS